MSTFSSGLVIAMVISLIFIVLLRFLAGIMVWVMIVLVILVIGYGTSGFKMFFVKEELQYLHDYSPQNFFRYFPLLHGVC